MEFLISVLATPVSLLFPVVKYFLTMIFSGNCHRYCNDWKTADVILDITVYMSVIGKVIVLMTTYLHSYVFISRRNIA